MKFERCYNPAFIPRILVDQMPDKEMSPDRFYDFLTLVISSPTHFLWLMIDDENEIQGFLWCELNLINMNIIVNELSTRKSQWNSGKMIDVVTEFLKVFMKENGIKKGIWVTNRPALFEKKNFTRSKNVYMEYVLEEE